MDAASPAPITDPNAVGTKPRVDLKTAPVIAPQSMFFWIYEK